MEQDTEHFWDFSDNLDLYISAADESWLDDFYAGDFFLESSLFNTFGMEAVRLTASSAPFHIPMPSAPGTAVEANELVIVDYSNAHDGYIMVRFLDPPPANEPVMVITVGPNGFQHNHIMLISREYDIIPLTAGSGEYVIAVGEPVNGQLAVLLQTKINADIADEFAPFLRPSRHINYTLDSKVVKKADELIGGRTDLDLIERIRMVYEFVVSHFEYDWDLLPYLAANPYYIPDLDFVLDYGKAICYGYSSVMAAMLRSQGIITRQVIGWMTHPDGRVEYHAWIDVYSTTEGWLTGIVFFDGNGYSRLDPTVASSGGETGERFAMDSSNYRVEKYH